MRPTATVPPPGRARMLRRGLAKRCPLCGSANLFTGWFRMKERCPGCGYLFEREEGFFLGAYVINLAIAQGLVILLAVVPAIVLLARNPDTSIVPIVVGGVLGAVVGPLAFYPFSKTIWTAFDLIMRPASTREPTDRI
ncbi:MAG TPA: DUF983 domain-containing protein [Acidimicrobiales bacterium]|nr:DUF983 domain-containing protein [Acidimicrobiales bacterium]